MLPNSFSSPNTPFARCFIYKGAIHKGRHIFTQRVISQFINQSDWDVEHWILFLISSSFLYPNPTNYSLQATEFLRKIVLQSGLYLLSSSQSVDIQKQFEIKCGSYHFSSIFCSLNNQIYATAFSYEGAVITIIIHYLLKILLSLQNNVTFYVLFLFFTNSIVKI